MFSYTFVIGVVLLLCLVIHLSYRISFFVISVLQDGIWYAFVLLFLDILSGGIRRSSVFTSTNPFTSLYIIVNFAIFPTIFQ